jgi:hypothetical protein
MHTAALPLHKQQLLSKGLTAEPQGLRNSWANSFQRVMSILVRELGTRRTPASSRVVTSFVNWERDLRRNLVSCYTPQSLVASLLLLPI